MLMKAKAAARRTENINTDAPIALVIGSGFGGLAAAVRLAAKGWRVQVLEKLDVPGGRARVHHVDGYTFDAGPTIITVPFLLEELWALAGRKLTDDVELRLIDPFYRVRFADGDHFDYSGDPDRCGSIQRRGLVTPLSWRRQTLATNWALNPSAAMLLIAQATCSKQFPQWPA